jgi:hypothetical protein
MWYQRKRFKILYAFFRVIPWRRNFICRRFVTLSLFHIHRQVGVKCGWIWEKLDHVYRKRFGSKIAWASRKEGDKLGAVQSTETGCGGCEADRAFVRVRSNCCVLGGCLPSLSLCRSGLQDFYTSLRKGDSHLICNSLTSPRHAPYLLHTLHSLFLFSEPPLTCHPPSNWLWLFSSQTFSCINTPTFLNPVTLHWVESFLKRYWFFNYSRNSLLFMESEGSLSCSQKHATCMCLEADEANPHSNITFP